MPVGETPEAHNKGKNVTYPTDAKLLHELQKRNSPGNVYLDVP